MSDMIDKLSQHSHDAGLSATESLTARVTIESMEERIGRGVRRRRARIGAVAAISVAVAGVGIGASPQLFSEMDLPLSPATQAPELLASQDSLSVFSDGSMTVVTDQGVTVEVPAPEPWAYVPYSNLDKELSCEPVPPGTFEAGWTFEDPSFAQLLGDGRPQADGPDGFTHLPNGGHAPATFGWYWPNYAFHFDADPGVAEHLMLRATGRIVGKDGTTYWHQGGLDSRPTVSDQTGTDSHMSEVQSRAWAGEGHCDASYGDAPDFLPKGDYYLRFLEVEVFLTDREGSVTLLGTHRSWSGIEGHQ